MKNVSGILPPPAYRETPPTETAKDMYFVCNPLKAFASGAATEFLRCYQSFQYTISLLVSSSLEISDIQACCWLNGLTVQVL